jgi:hypothetical protein
MEDNRMNNVSDSRPRGITLLAWLHLVGGALAPIVTVFLIFVINRNPEGQAVFGRFGISPILVYLGIVILGALGFASGLGMLRGKTWGWHLGSFYYVYAILRNTNALVMILYIMSRATAEELAGMSHGPNYYVSKHGIRIIVSGLIYTYFYKMNVLQFFGLSERPKWKMITVEVCIAVIVAVVPELFG